MGNLLKSLLTIGTFVLIVQSSIGQKTQNTQRVSERSMILKTTVVQDKSINTITIEEKEYHWFDSKKNAIEYFIQMGIKYIR